MEIPYDKLTLISSLEGAVKKLEKDGVKEEILNKVKSFSSPDRVSFNQSVAKYHGVSISELINSPNYQILGDQYADYCIMKVFNIYKEFGFDDKESWALICLSFGNL